MRDSHGVKYFQIISYFSILELFILLRKKLFLNPYKTTSQEAEIKAIHAGLECGVLREKFTGMEMVSFGPDIMDVHTPDERLNISSVRRTWKFLLEVLKSI